MIADQVAHIVAGDGARAAAVLCGLPALVVGVRHGLDAGLGRFCATCTKSPPEQPNPVRSGGVVSGVTRFVIRSEPLSTA